MKATRLPGREAAASVEWKVCMVVTPVFDGQKTGLAIDGEDARHALAAWPPALRNIPGRGMARPGSPRRNSRLGRHYPALSLSGL
jgi:hypothetical protein